MKYEPTYFLHVCTVLLSYSTLKFISWLKSYAKCADVQNANCMLRVCCKFDYITV